MNIKEARITLRNSSSEGKYKVTNQRTDLITLISRVEFFTINELVAIAKELGILINKSSMYKNINLFIELGFASTKEVIKDKKVGGNGFVTVYKSHIKNL